MTTLPALAAQVAELLTPAVTAGTAPKRASLTSAIMTAFRPYVEAAVTGDTPRALLDTRDRRERRWLVSLAFYTGTPGSIDTLVAESEGRRTAGLDGEVTSYGGDSVTGLDGAAELIAEYAAKIQAPLSDYGAPNMRRALGYLRPTISRQGGHATMRRTSECGRWHLIADIFREDALPQT